MISHWDFICISVTGDDVGHFFMLAYTFDVFYRKHKIRIIIFVSD